MGPGPVIVIIVVAAVLVFCITLLSCTCWNGKAVPISYDGTLKDDDDEGITFVSSEPTTTHNHLEHHPSITDHSHPSDPNHTDHTEHKKHHHPHLIIPTPAVDESHDPTHIDPLATHHVTSHVDPWSSPMKHPNHKDAWSALGITHVDSWSSKCPTHVDADKDMTRGDSMHSHHGLHHVDSFSSHNAHEGSFHHDPNRVDPFSSHRM